MTLAQKLETKTYYAFCLSKRKLVNGANTTSTSVLP